MPSKFKGSWRPRAVRWLALAVVAVAVVAGVARLRPSAGQQGPAAMAPPVTVTLPVTRAIPEWLEFPGQFAAVDSVEVRPRVTGYLTQIRFTDGQMVRAGDLLFVIDPRPYEDALAQARAQAAQAQAALALAKRQLTRGGELRRQDYLAQSDYDVRTQQMRAAEAQLDAANAAVRDAQLNLDFCHVTAPVSGRVGTHEVSVGNLVNGGGQTTLLTTIVSLDPIDFTFDIDEHSFLALERAFAQGRVPDGRSGKLPAEVRLDDESDWGHKGRIDFIDNQVDRGSGTVRARAVLPNPGLFVTPGQFGRVRVPLDAPRPTLLVPAAAIVSDQSQKMVMTVAPDGTVVPKHVVLGPVVGDMQAIRSGIGASDRVIVSGLLRARPGGKVTAQFAKAGAAATKPE